MANPPGKNPDHQPPPRAPDFVQRSKVLIVRRQYQEAAKVCRLGLLANPTNIEGRLMLGMALMALHRFEEVLSEMRVVLELDGRNSMAFFLRGEALYNKGEIKQARLALNRAHELDPSNTKVRELLANIDEDTRNPLSDLVSEKTVNTKVYPAQVGRPEAKSAEEEGEQENAGESSYYPEVGTVQEPLNARTKNIPAKSEEAQPLSYAGPLLVAPLSPEESDEYQSQQYSTAPFFAPLPGAAISTIGSSQFQATNRTPLQKEETGTETEQEIVSEQQLRKYQASLPENEPLKASASITEATPPPIKLPIAPSALPSISPHQAEPSRIVHDPLDALRMESLAAIAQAEEDLRRNLSSVEKRGGPLPAKPSPRPLKSVSTEEENSQENTAVKFDSPSMSTLFGEGEPEALEQQKKFEQIKDQATSEIDESEREEESTKRNAPKLLNNRPQPQIDSYPHSIEEAPSSPDQSEIAELSVILMPEDTCAMMPPLPPETSEQSQLDEERNDQHPGAMMPSIPEPLPGQIRPIDDQDVLSAEDEETNIDHEAYSPSLKAARGTLDSEPLEKPSSIPAEPSYELSPPQNIPETSQNFVKASPTGQVSRPSLDQPLPTRQIHARPEKRRSFHPIGSGQDRHEAVARIVATHSASKPKVSGSPNIRVRKTRTGFSSPSWLTVILGEPGKERWIFLLLGVVAVLVVAVSIGLALRYFRLGEKLENKRKQAIERRLDGNYPDFYLAIKNFSEIASRRPNDQLARGTLTRLLAEMQLEFGESVTVNRNILSKESGFSLDLMVTNICHQIDQGALASADALLEQARKTAPQEAIVFYLSGRLAYLQGNLSRAEQYLLQAHQLLPRDTITIRALGEALAAQGKNAAALATYSKALALNRAHIATLLSKARLEMALGQNMHGVETVLLDILQGSIAPLVSRSQRAKASLLMSRLQQEYGQYEESQNYLAIAKQWSSENDELFLEDIGDYLLDKEQYAEAEPIIARAQKIGIGRIAPFLLRARLEFIHGRANMATEELRKAPAPQTVDSWLMRAKLFLVMGRFADAQNDVERANRLAPNMIDGQMIKIRALLGQERSEVAEQYIRGLLVKQPQNGKILMALGELYYRQGKNKEAQENFQMALGDKRTATLARFKLAEVFIAQNNYAEALQMLRECSRKKISDPLVLMQLADWQFKVGDFTEARTNYQRVVKALPQNGQTHLSLARIFVTLRQYSDADREIRLADKYLSAQDPVLNITRAQLFIANNKAPQAINILTKWRGHSTYGLEVAALLIKASILNNDLNSLRGIIEETLRKFASAPSAEVLAGKASLFNGQMEKAIKHLRRAVSLSQRSPLSPVERADMLVTLGRALHANGKMNEAENYFNQAMQSCRLCAEPLYRWGLILDEQGKMSEALSNMQRALTLDPGMSEIYYDLGQVYERGGQKLEAIKAYSKFLSFGPPADLAQAAREAIQNLQNAP